jgi:flavodoxin I
MHMNILLVFATNSGTTQTVAQMITDALTTAGHSVTVKEARMAAPEDFSTPQAVIIGSPSWDFDGNEGFPHEDLIALMNKMKGAHVPKPFALFGLGDSSYKFFCGAVDHLEKFVTEVGGTLITPSLKIDKYYSDMDGNNAKITTWIEELKKKLTT